MKVAFVGPFPLPGAPISGGTERVIDCLIQEMSAKIKLALFVAGSAIDGVHEHYGVRVEYLRAGPLPGFMRYWREDARVLAAALKRYGGDLVHFHCGSGVGRFIDRPAIVTVHGILERDIVEKAGDARLRRLAAMGAARIIAPIEAAARERIGNAIVITPYVRSVLPDLKNLKTYDIPNPISQMFVKKYPDCKERRERTFIAVQRIGPLKDTLGLLRIATRALSGDPNARLIICGSGANKSYLAKCSQAVVSTGLEDRIVFAGHKNIDELIALLDRASCFVTTSRQEIAPMVVAEALARGVPVLAPEAFGIKYMITPGRNGFFLPKGGIDAQARVLRQGLDHDWDRAAIAEEAWRTYSPQRVAELTLAAYRDVLAGRS